LSNLSGGIAFLFVMFLLFQSIFTFATPLMDGVENLIGMTATFVTDLTGPGMLADFLNDAIFGGLGSFLVFVPQIMVLTLIIGMLEDSGYLARAALICHRPLSYFGLSGRSFIPYLSAHACAIPAIMAARTIESPRKRLITMLTIPLMSCSARLPVYALLVAVLIPDTTYFGGLVNLQGTAFFGLYFFGILTALMVSLVLSGSKLNDDEKSDMPFILELPTYRLPHWKPLIHRVMSSAKQFVYRAGPIIFMVSLAIWLLGYFPTGSGGLQNSYLGIIGHWIEPLFTPLSLDWRYGVAILMSFLAREVFVGALGTLFGIDGADENIAGLAANIQADGLTFGAGMGILLFYVVALQCVATVATLKAETGSTKLITALVIGYGVLAYLLAMLCAQLL
jgi:ferrous iron transport protein B